MAGAHAGLLLRDRCPRVGVLPTSAVRGSCGREIQLEAPAGISEQPPLDVPKPAKISSAVAVRAEPTWPRAPNNVANMTPEYPTQQDQKVLQNWWSKYRTEPLIFQCFLMPLPASDSLGSCTSRAQEPSAGDVKEGTNPPKPVTVEKTPQDMPAQIALSDPSPTNVGHLPAQDVPPDPAQSALPVPAPASTGPLPTQDVPADPGHGVSACLTLG